MLIRMQGAKSKGPSALRDGKYTWVCHEEEARQKGGLSQAKGTWLLVVSLCEIGMHYWGTPVSQLALT